MVCEPDPGGTSVPQRRQANNEADCALLRLGRVEKAMRAKGRREVASAPGEGQDFAKDQRARVGVQDCPERQVYRGESVIRVALGFRGRDGLSA